MPSSKLRWKTTMDSTGYVHLHGWVVHKVYVNFARAEWILYRYMNYIFLYSIFFYTYMQFSGELASSNFHFKCSSNFRQEAWPIPARRGGLHRRPCLWLGRARWDRDHFLSWTTWKCRICRGNKAISPSYGWGFFCLSCFLPCGPSKSKENLKPNKVQETNFRVPAEFSELYPHHGSAVWLNSSEAEQKETPCRPLPLGDLAPWRIALPIPDTPTDETFAGLRGGKSKTGAYPLVN